MDARDAWVAVSVCIVVVPLSWGLGQETFGDEPLFAENYSDWPGLIHVLNQPDRLYSTWVNGNEDFYYSGDIEAFNAALRKFAEADLEVHELVLRPGPGVVASWHGNREIEFSWHVNVRGGIAKHLSTEDKGDLVWNPHPMVSLYVTEDMPLDKLNIPEQITVHELSDVSKRVRTGLSSTDQTVRGWGAGVLSRLDPYDDANLEAIVKLLDDDVDWVRLNAVLAIKAYGTKAQVGEDAVRKCLESDDEALREHTQQTLDYIDTVEDAPDEALRFSDLSNKIAEFVVSVQTSTPAKSNK